MGDDVALIDPKQLRKICEQCKDLRVVPDEGKEYAALLVGRNLLFVDPTSPTDSLSSTFDDLSSVGTVVKNTFLELAEDSASSCEGSARRRTQSEPRRMRVWRSWGCRLGAQWTSMPAEEKSEHAFILRLKVSRSVLV